MLFGTRQSLLQATSSLAEERLAPESAVGLGSEELESLLTCSGRRYRGRGWTLVA